MLPPLQILYEDNHCLAIAKPQNTLTTHYQGGEETLDRQVKAYLKTKHRKPGNVFLGVVQRLDRPVSGVLLFARTSKAAARLTQQFKDGQIKKTYWAILEGIPSALSDSLQHWIRKNPQTKNAEVVSIGTVGAKCALLQYEIRSRESGFSWAEVYPQTGRTHQIRVQLAYQGHPIFGDRRYGAVSFFDRAIALHARDLTFMHPIRQEPITLVADLPTSWRRFHRLLGDQSYERQLPR